MMADKPTTGGALSDIQKAMDSLDLEVDVTIDPEHKVISGHAKTRYRLSKPLDSLEVELVNSFKVTKVLVDGKVRPFKRGHHKLFVKLAEPVEELSLEVHYEGQPQEAKRPPWDGGVNWSRTDSGKPWVGLSCQGEGGQVWMPCKTHQQDKFSSVSLKITVPKGLYVAANGLLQGVSERIPGWQTYHWKTNYPITSYNISFNIADYRVIERTYKGKKEMPVLLYFLKEYQKADQIVEGDYDDKLNELADLTVEYLEFYARYYGEFPFIDEKFGLVHTAYLGMEHQTINSYGAHFSKPFGYDSLMLHEMGHEWWGNKVTVTELGHYWIQEGICTYTTGVFIEEKWGLERALQFYAGNWGRITDSRPLAVDEPLPEDEAYFTDIYNKGAVIMHAMRFLLGKEVMDKVLYTFAHRKDGTYDKTVTTYDFLETAEAVSGKDLDWFVRRYFYVAEKPYLKYMHADGNLHLAWDDTYFNMPVEVAIEENGQTRYERVLFENGKGQLAIPEGAEFEVDPRQWIYMRSRKTKKMPEAKVRFDGPSL